MKILNKLQNVSMSSNSQLGLSANSKSSLPLRILIWNVAVSTASWLAVLSMSLIGAWLWCSYHFIMSASLLSTLVFNAVFWLEVWSYLSTSFTDPGTPECPEWQAWADHNRGDDSLEQKSDSTLSIEKSVQDDRAQSSGRKIVRPGQRTFCNKCNCVRPERAHHCKFKGTCVLRMDHFCWLTGNCVGWRNNKQFILTLFYGVMTCFVFIATAKLPPPHLGRPTLQPHIVWVNSAHQGWTRLIDSYLPENDEILAVGWKDNRESHCQETEKAHGYGKLCPLPEWTSDLQYLVATPLGTEDDEDEETHAEEDHDEKVDGVEHATKEINHFKTEGAFLEDKSRASQGQPDVLDDNYPWKRLISLYGPTSFFDLPALAKSARVTCGFLLLWNLYWLFVTLRIVATNTTTVESFIKGQNPYRLSTAWGNWTQMMGAVSLWMLIPVFPVGRACDGTHFPTKQGSIQRSSTISQGTEL